MDAAPGAPDAEAPVADAAVDAAADAGFSGQCASVFGQGLSAGFGRIDGVVYAVQKPTDQPCTMPNSDHLIVQVWMKGDVYRLVVNVKSDKGDPRVWLATVDHALPEPSFAEGWHPGAGLDYVSSLDAHAPQFEAFAMDALVTKLSGMLEVGAPVAVYATSGAGRPDSAHLVHRNKPEQDGAIVLAPTSAHPTFVLFRFDEQTF